MVLENESEGVSPRVIFEADVFKGIGMIRRRTRELKRRKRPGSAGEAIHAREDSTQPQKNTIGRILVCTDFHLDLTFAPSDLQVSPHQTDQICQVGTRTIQVFKAPPRNPDSSSSSALLYVFESSLYL